MNGAETLPGEVKTDRKVDTVVMMKCPRAIVRAVRANCTLRREATR
jgi:hypothetical protein